MLYLPSLWYHHVRHTQACIAGKYYRIVYTVTFHDLFIATSNNKTVLQDLLHNLEGMFFSVLHGQ